jgi:hypothetical protein
VLPPVESTPEPIVRRLAFDEHSSAVITAFDGSTTVSWSASVGITDFVHAVESILMWQAAEPEVSGQRYGEHEMAWYEPIDPNGNLWLPESESSFELVRIDLTSTRSVAWQRLDRASVVVGLGDTSEQLALDTDPLDQFMEKTAVQSVNRAMTISAVHNALDNARRAADERLQGGFA